MELIIQNENKVYMPIVVSEITIQSERKGSPSTVKFDVVLDEELDITEGNAVRIKTDDTDVFYGFIFTINRSKESVLSITAYDQLRYLKNKDTYVYASKKASELIKLIAEDFKLQIGGIEDTGYVIPSMIEENTTLFDIIQNALDLTLENTNQMYVLYDNFGKISLKNMSNMILNILIDEETAETYDYTSSIDGETYNTVKLTYDNEQTGYRDVYVAKDSENVNSWGVLQYFDTLEDGENGSAKAETLLDMYNKKTRQLTIKNALGDLRVKAGCMIVVQLDLGDVKLNNLMLVEKCKHVVTKEQRMMELTLKGGEFIA